MVRERSIQVGSYVLLIALLLGLCDGPLVPFVDAHGVVVDDAQLAAAIDARAKPCLGIDVAEVGESRIAVEVFLAHEAGVARGAFHRPCV